MCCHLFDLRYAAPSSGVPQDSDETRGERLQGDHRTGDGGLVFPGYTSAPQDSRGQDKDREDNSTQSKARKIAVLVAGATVKRPFQEERQPGCYI